MTFGYWFWLGVACSAGAVILLALTARQPQRSVRSVHAVVLFALLAFGGFKCARDEHQRAALLAAAPVVYTVAVTGADRGGMKFMEDRRRVEAVEYAYSIAGKEYLGLAVPARRYTVERDFYPEDIGAKCLLVRALEANHGVSELFAVLRECPATVPVTGWTEIPPEILGMVDDVWLRESLP